MSLKTIAARSNATNDPLETLGFERGSHNGCSNYQLNLIRNRPKEERLLALPEGEWQALTARFWSRVERHASNACWPWRLSCYANGGHGQFTFRIDGVQHHFYAHRIAWLLTHRESVGDLKICHHCDNPPCCNPNHHFKASQAANLDDARRKGRLDESKPRRLKLTPEQRLEIQAAPAAGRSASLATRYGVSASMICHIRAGRFAGALVVAAHHICNNDESVQNTQMGLRRVS